MRGAVGDGPFAVASRMEHSCHGWVRMLRAPTQGGPDERSGDATMQTRLSTQTHADLIRSVIAGHRAGLPIDEVIRRSWSRCLTTYALDPYQSKRPNSVERSEEHTSELQSQSNLVCRLLLEKKKKNKNISEELIRIASK